MESVDKLRLTGSAEALLAKFIADKQTGRYNPQVIIDMLNLIKEVVDAA